MGHGRPGSRARSEQGCARPRPDCCAPAHFPLPAAALTPATSKPRSSCHQTGCLHHADRPTRGQGPGLHGAPPGEGRRARSGFPQQLFHEPRAPPCELLRSLCAKLWPRLGSPPARSSTTVSVESLCHRRVQTGTSPLHPVVSTVCLFAHPRWPPALCHNRLALLPFPPANRAFGPDCRWHSGGGDIMKGPSETLGPGAYNLN